jgi:RHH-type transcriptional regulator, proline utilization regulon repressor / proline dehydrogenase / delta 1-pyrroline-5-carboxylate dehydrogenase
MNPASLYNAAPMDALEARTQEIGRETFQRMREEVRRAGPVGKLRDRALAWMMRHDEMKTSLFRLVDVLPSLNSAGEITRHLKEYVGPSIRHLPQRGLFSHLAAAAAMAVTTRAARSFIAAADVSGAADAAIALRQRGMEFTIDLLGEAVVSETEADQYARRYHDLINGLASRLGGANVNVSVKLSCLYSQFDPIDPRSALEAVAARLRPILLAARQCAAFVCIDMEQSAFKDLTLRIFKEVLLEPDLRDWPNVGIAIQAYLPASGEDLTDLAAWAKHRGTPVGVRLVKGAYWDFECVLAAENNWPVRVYTDKNQTDANFERLTEFLIAHHDLLRPAVASHNIRDIAHALAAAERAGLAPHTIEFQMLYGMAAPIKTALVDRGERVRVYAPVGKLLPGMAYLVRRLLENTSNQSFLRAALLEHVPQEELLMNPSLKPPPKPLPRPPADEFRNEPPTDFSRSGARDSMQQALSNMTPTRRPLVIGGQKIETADWMPSVNPSHKKQIVGHAAKATAEHARRAIAAAKSAFADWRNQSADVRADLLRRLADQLRQRRFEITALEVCECGKPWREADADVAEAIDFCVYYARQARQMGRGHRVDLPGETNRHFYEPRGVAAVIAPWNFPLAILTGMATAAVVTGNTVILKPAEQSSLVGAMLMDAFEAAGAPAGVVNYLPGIGEEVGPELLSSPEVALIAFTGSRQVGLEIMQAAARVPAGQHTIKKVIAEMGGKNAIIVDADADLDEAIHGITASAFGYAGQKCSACSRLIILQEIYEPFLQRLAEATRSLRVAPAEDPGCFVGPVIDADAHARILGTIEKARMQAKLLFAGDTASLADEGYYIAPHLFADVDPASTLAQEEIFGPVLACMKARDMNHAIDLANGVAYALTGGLYSRSPAAIQRVSREFRVGDLYINRKITGALVGRQPFGGFKLSGAGCQAGGPDYLTQFVVGRVVTENTLRHGFAPEAELTE